MSGKLEELKGLLEKATKHYPVPFHFESGTDYALPSGDYGESALFDAHGEWVVTGLSDDVGNLIVWLVNNAPALLSAQAREIERLREALKPFAEPHAMGDAYVQFSPQLVRQARAALQTQAGGE